MSRTDDHPGWIYILRLEHGCWYVGHTHNLRDRLKDHFTKDPKTQWTQLHRPVALQMFTTAPIAMESVVTCDLAALVGIDLVRGALPLLRPAISEKMRQLVPSSSFILNEGPTHPGTTKPLDLVLGKKSFLSF